MKYILLALFIFSAQADIDKQCKEAGYVKKVAVKKNKKRINKKSRPKEVQVPDTVVLIRETTVEVENVTKNRLILFVHNPVTGISTRNSTTPVPGGTSGTISMETQRSLVPGIMYVRDIGKFNGMAAIDQLGNVQIGAGINF